MKDGLSTRLILMGINRKDKEINGLFKRNLQSMI